MAITTNIQIVVVYSTAPGEPEPPFDDFFLEKRYRLVERPAAAEGAFTLYAIAGDQTLEILLSAVESAQIAEMVAQLPGENMSAPPHSFDGVVYDLVLLRGETTTTYQWANEDWRYESDQPVEAWERIQAFADRVRELDREV